MVPSLRVRPPYPSATDPSPPFLSAEATLAPTLLCLDLPVTLGPNAEAPEAAGSYHPAGGRGGGKGGGRGGRNGPSSRLSPLGASVLIGVLGYGQGACRQFTDRCGEP